MQVLLGVVDGPQTNFDHKRTGRQSNNFRKVQSSHSLSTSSPLYLPIHLPYVREEKHPVPEEPRVRLVVDAGLLGGQSQIHGCTALTKRYI